MSRRSFLAAGAAGTAWPRASRAAQRKLNVILILIDDMGWTDLGCYGSDFYRTPNIDRLASGGVKFTNAYAACPVCSPTRAAIMTGKHPARLHITDWIPGRKQWPPAKLVTPEFTQQLPLEETTIAEVLRPAGYATASIGKWHLGSEPYWPDKQGFDLNIAGTDRGSPASYFGPFDLPGLKGGSPGDYLTERLTDEAVKFIEANRGRPFFLYLPNFAVHIPLQARRAAVARYEAQRKAGAGHQNPIYAAMVESVDQAVGRLRRTLDELGIAGRTAILFTSDNGGLRFEGRAKEAVTSNAPLRAGKGHAYEGGIRVPLIAHWPGVTKPGAISEEPVSSVDFLPSIAEMAGIRSPQGIDGVSFAPVLRGSGHAKRDALYWHYPHYSNQGGVPAGAVRQGDWKLIEFYEDGRLELYNLREDAGETRNLVKRNPGLAAELHGRLRRWRARVNASMPAVNPAYDPATAGQGLTGAEPPTPPI